MPFEQGVSLKASLSLTDGHFVYWQIWINHQPPISMLKRRMVFGTFQASGGVGLPSVDSGCGFGQRIMGRKRVVWKVLLVGGEKMFRGCHGRCPGTAYIYTLKNIYVYMYVIYTYAISTFDEHRDVCSLCLASQTLYFPDAHMITILFGGVGLVVLDYAVLCNGQFRAFLQICAQLVWMHMKHESHKLCC